MVKYLNAEIGDMDIAMIRTKHLADILDKYEQQGKFETRVRLQGAAVAIMGVAVGRGWIEINPFVGVRFAAAFTSPNKTRENRPAIVEPVAFGHLLRKIDLYEGRDDNLIGFALKLLALTFVRPGDVAEARWEHFDLYEAKWSIPFDELKMRTQRRESDFRVGEPYEVPLAQQTLTLLRKLHKQSGDTPYLFPSRRGSRTITTNALELALDAMGYRGIHCPHGFRSSASTMLNRERMIIEGKKVLRWPEQGALIEVQLDHNDETTRAIYNRGGLWDERAELMQARPAR
jgi:integrase